MKKKSISLIAIILIIIAIVIIVAICLGKRSKTEESREENVVQEEEQEEFSLIDMENTENVEILGDNVKENNSKALLEEKTLLGMKISNIRLVAENGMTTFTAKVENTSGIDFSERMIEIVFKNQDGSEYARLPGFLPDIKSGESNQIDASTTADMSNAYDFIIE